MDNDLRKWWKERENALLWGGKPYVPKYEDFVKLAWININGKRQMAGVHNEDMTAYEMDLNTPTVKLPLERIIDEYTFERWCTTFDV